MDRRAEGDNPARKEQRSRAPAKNVTAKVAFCFHSYISLLRREPLVAIDPCGKRAWWSSRGRRLTNLTRMHLTQFLGFLEIRRIAYECFTRLWRSRSWHWLPADLSRKPFLSILFIESAKIYGFFSSHSFRKAGSLRKGSQDGSSRRRAGVTAVGSYQKLL